MRFGGHKAIDDPIAEAYVLQIPNFEAPKVNVFVPILLPSADMEDV